MILAVDDPRHGTATGYINHGCRCDPCREANAAYRRELYFKPCVDGCGRDAWHGPGPHRPGRCAVCAGAQRQSAEHGTETRYTHGCRCDDCRAAGTAARRRRRQANLEAARAYDRSRMAIRVKDQRERRRRKREQVAA